MRSKFIDLDAIERRLIKEENPQYVTSFATNASLRRLPNGLPDLPVGSRLVESAIEKFSSIREEGSLEKAPATAELADILRRNTAVLICGVQSQVVQVDDIHTNMGPPSIIGTTLTNIVRAWLPTGPMSKVNIFGRNSYQHENLLFLSFRATRQLTTSC
jgi:hypothetical protein